MCHMQDSGLLQTRIKRITENLLLARIVFHVKRRCGNSLV